MGTGDATPAGNYEIASAALGLLTATYHDDNHFGPVTMDYLTAMGSDATTVLRIATGITGLARQLIAMRQTETGASPDETLAELGRRLGEVLPGSG